MKKIIMIIFMFVILGVGTIKAEESYLNLYPIGGVYSYQLNKNGSYFSSNQKRYEFKSKTVYCIEPGLPILTRYFDIYSINTMNYSEEVRNKVELMGYYGYDYPKHKTDVYFLATQELIWEYISGIDVSWYTGINKGGNEINVEYEKNQIKKLIERHNVRPSFKNTKIKKIKGEDVTIVDNNKVIGDYEVIEGNAIIEGDKLIVKGDESAIKIKKKRYNTEESHVYKKSGSQSFLFPGYTNDIMDTIEVEIIKPRGKIEIEKQAEVPGWYNQKFYYEMGGLKGVIYKIYARNNIYEDKVLRYKKDLLIGTYITDEHGKITTVELPAGDYYIKEYKTPNGYILDSKEYDVTIDKSINGITKKITLINDRQDVNITFKKTGEKFLVMSANGGIYQSEKQYNVKFGLYNKNDMYNSTGALILPKDTLMETLTTDSEGMISKTISMPADEYYIKEISELEGYKKNDKKYEFSVIGDSQSKIIEIDLQTIQNERIKTNLIINKIDSETKEKLDGVYFEIYNELNKLIYTDYTRNGQIKITGLDYGKYSVIEKKPLNGYKGELKTYHIEVLDETPITLDIENTRIPKTTNIQAKTIKIIILLFLMGINTVIVGKKYEK